MSRQEELQILIRNQRKVLSSDVERLINHGSLTDDWALAEVGKTYNDLVKYHKEFNSTEPKTEV